MSWMRHWERIEHCDFQQRMTTVDEILKDIRRNMESI